MTLATALIGGLLCGYFLGFGRRAVGIFLVIWVPVLLIQSFFLLPAGTTDDPSYWPVQAAILAVAVLMVWLGAKVHAWRTRVA